MEKSMKEITNEMLWAKLDIIEGSTISNALRLEIIDRKLDEILTDETKAELAGILEPQLNAVSNVNAKVRTMQDVMKNMMQEKEKPVKKSKKEILADKRLN